VIEREAKLGAPASYELPDLKDVVPGATVEPAPVAVLDATYYDGASRSLAGIGSTVRYRTGDGAARWTVKVAAAGSDGTMLAREEIDVDAPPAPVPAEVVALVAEYLGAGDARVPVARLVTERHRLVVRGANGDALAEVDDDLVRVLDADDEVAAFREVEVELAGDAPVAVLDAVVARLRAAGAGAPDPTPKLVRALRLLGAAPEGPPTG
jgi:inorganic triphosphatase YgiF